MGIAWVIFVYTLIFFKLKKNTTDVVVRVLNVLNELTATGVVLYASDSG
jgi:hypothetical protein